MTQGHIYVYIYIYINTCLQAEDDGTWRCSTQAPLLLEQHYIATISGLLLIATFSGFYIAFDLREVLGNTHHKQQHITIKV